MNRLSAAPHQTADGARLPAGGILQRKCDCGNHTVAGGKCAECSKKQMSLQRATQNSQSDTQTSGGVPAIVHDVLRSTGQPLDAATRTFMEPRFGHDFSKVRVHTDAKAAESARAVNATAYTVGRNIVFGEGGYPAQTSAGRRLMAHELTHSLQQSADGGEQLQSKLSVGSSNDFFEQEADRISGSIIANRSETIGDIHAVSGVVQRTCGPEAIGQPKGCSAALESVDGPRFLFQRNCDDFQGGNELDLRADAATIAQGETIEIHGLASTDGDADFNLHLSCARAVRARRVIEEVLAERGVTATITLFHHGAVEGDATLMRSIVLVRSKPPQKEPEPETPESPTAQTQNIKVVVKSFIAPIGSRVGFILGPGMPPLSDPLSTQFKLRALAQATDINFSENPTTDSKDKGYRLYSERTFAVTCLNGQLKSVVPLPLDTDTGQEGPLQPPALITSGVTTKHNGVKDFEFAWTGKGRPHIAAEPAFQLVSPRLSFFIWHSIKGKIECNGSDFNVSVTLKDSAFPSDVVFVNNRVKARSTQGPFSNLWVSDPSDRTLVQ